jgi:type 1 glutamine amidotransferase
MLLWMIGVASAAGPATRPAGASPAATPPAVKKVVIVGGPKSHGPEGNGIHDYNWSARLLRAMLEQSNVRSAVRVEHHLNGWPADAKAVEDADVIVVLSDGRDGDKYTEAQHLASPERVKQVDALARRGCGIVLIHFSTFAPDQYAAQVLDWVGAYFDWETDGKRQWYSAIKTLEADVKPAEGAADHPVLRGVKPYRIKEEFYYNLRFADDAKAVQPLLEVPALGGRADRGNTITWARQRPGGGRGFGTTSGHFYANWANDHFRRTVLNGIVWSAGGEVPPDGVEAPMFARDEVNRLVPTR